MERMNWHVNLGLFEYRGYVFKYWEAMLRETVLLLRMEWNGFHAMGFVGELPSLGAEDNLGLLRRAELSSGGGEHLLLTRPSFQRIRQI